MEHTRKILVYKSGFIDFEFYNQYGRGGPVILRNWVDLIWNFDFSICMCGAYIKGEVFFRRLINRMYQITLISLTSLVKIWKLFT